MKIAINTCNGGFNLSEQAIIRYAELSGFSVYPEKVFWWHSNYYKIPVLEFHELRYKALEDQATQKLLKDLVFYVSLIPRNSPELIRVIEELGDAANGIPSKLKIVEIPDDVDWVIEENDGIEFIAERHRTWS